MTETQHVARPYPWSCREATATPDTGAEERISSWTLRSPVTLDKALLDLSCKMVTLTLHIGCQKEGLQGLGGGGSYCLSQHLSCRLPSSEGGLPSVSSIPRMWGPRGQSQG